MQYGDLNSFGVWGERFPAAYRGNVIMSVIPRACKIVSKSDALPELFNLKLKTSGGQLQRGPPKELVKGKYPELELKIRALDAYLVST